MFETQVDGNSVSKSKPDPEVFLKGADNLGLKPEEIIVFEDSIKGIKAANDGGFFSVGIGSKDELADAQIVISSFENIDLATLTQQLSVN